MELQSWKPSVWWDSLVFGQLPFLQEAGDGGPGRVGAHAGLYEGQRLNWLPGKQSPRARPLTTTGSPAQVIPSWSQVWLLCVAASSHPASTWTLPVTGSSPPCAPSLLSLGGCISHLWNQTWLRLCPHRAACTLVPVCNGIPPPHSGGSLFQAKHAPGRAGSPNIQLPNRCPTPGSENHGSGSRGRSDSAAGQPGPSLKSGSVPSPVAIFTSKARPSASSGVSCLLADEADEGDTIWPSRGLHKRRETRRVFGGLRPAGRADIRSVPLTAWPSPAASGCAYLLSSAANCATRALVSRVTCGCHTVLH